MRAIVDLSGRLQIINLSSEKEVRKGTSVPDAIEKRAESQSETESADKKQSEYISG